METTRGIGGVCICVKIQCGKLAVLQRNRALFGVKNGDFRHFHDIENKQRVSRGVDVESHILSTCLDALKEVFYWHL